MGKYLKQFNNHAAYAAAQSGLILPNVSLCVQESDVHYNPFTPPTPIAVEGDVQVFLDENCTQYATGIVNEVYVRINVPWVNTYWTDGINDNTFSALGPSQKYPDDKYGFSLWTGHFTPEYDEPFTAGQIIKLTLYYETDATNKLKIFSNPNP